MLCGWGLRVSDADIRCISMNIASYVLHENTQCNERWRRYLMYDQFLTTILSKGVKLFAPQPSPMKVPICPTC